MRTDTAVANSLALGNKFGGKLFGGIDAVIGAIILDVNSSGGRFAFEAYFGLDCFGPSEART